MSIFKSNDIRGIYPGELSEETAEKIGFCLPEFLGAKRIVVGRDGRNSSDVLFRSLSQGINKGGADVYDIGYCDTPALYFATAKYGFEGSVMITASHNPPEYNGMKVSGREAVPVGKKDGLDKIEEKLRKGFSVPEKGTGKIVKHDIRKDYIAHLLTFTDKIKDKKVVIDCSEGAAGFYINDLVKNLPGEYHILFDKPDGNFPNRDPDPLKTRGREYLINKIISTGADFGVCFDGDADRAVFFDEKGNFISPDIITSLLGLYFFNYSLDALLESRSGSAFYDIRSSNCVKEFISKTGGTAVACKTGHSHIKKIMRENNGIFAGELSGHYYFRDNFFCDSGFIAFLTVLSSLSLQEKSLGDFVESVNPYSFSGEINFTVSDIESVIKKIEKEYSHGIKTDIDGVRFDFDSWWFIIRSSTAEPVLRLVVEAESRAEMEKRVKEISAFIS